ncbi:MAG TPA: hypothetical protein VNW06_10710 [Cytophagaceae bacterium]|nr:hypothetical protein [Cytophagaceae bacterium]
MKNKKHLLFLLLLVPIVTFGQVKLSKDFRVTVGTPYPVIDAPDKEYFSDGKGQAIAVKSKGEKVTIQRYDISKMAEVSRKEYEDFPPASKLQKIMKLGDKLFYIYASVNKKDKTEDLYSREVNMADGTFGTPKLLLSTSKEVKVSSYMESVTTAMFGIGSPIKYEINTSFDNSKLLIRYRLKPAERDDSKNYDILGFYVYDANMEKQWGGEVKMPYTEKQMNNIAYGVTREGKAFMLAYLNESKEFELLNISSDLKVETNKIAIDGKLIFQELKLRESVDGNISCIGFYANGIDFKVNWTGNSAFSFNTNGILSFTMDQKGKVLQNNNFEFPLELINQYESAKSKEKNEKREEGGKAGINDVKMIDVNIDADGNTTVVGEQQYVRKEFVINNTKNVYYYADLIATKFDKNGKLIWMKKLPKTQAGLQGKGGMSVKYIKGNGANYILYLDNVKNANIQLSETPEKHSDGRGGFLTAYKIDDATGAIEKHSICDINNIDGTEAFQFKTSRIFNAADKVFMLEIYIKGKEDTMVKMELTK